MTYFDSGVDVFNAFSHLIMEMLRNSNFKSTAHSKEELNTILIGSILFLVFTVS